MLLPCDELIHHVVTRVEYARSHTARLRHTDELLDTGNSSIATGEHLRILLDGLPTTVGLDVSLASPALLIGTRINERNIGILSRELAPLDSIRHPSTVDSRENHTDHSPAVNHLAD